jgi:hypothetical protein
MVALWEVLLCLSEGSVCPARGKQPQLCRGQDNRLEKAMLKEPWQVPLLVLAVVYVITAISLQLQLYNLTKRVDALKGEGLY